MGYPQLNLPARESDWRSLGSSARGRAARLAHRPHSCGWCVLAAAPRSIAIRIARAPPGSSPLLVPPALSMADELLELLLAAFQLAVIQLRTWAQTARLVRPCLV